MSHCYTGVISATLLALVLCLAENEPARALTLFRYESQAQRHCPEDTVVWLDLEKRRYYTKGQKRYATGYSGSFACRGQVRNGSYRRSLLGRR